MTLPVPVWGHQERKVFHYWYHSPQGPSALIEGVGYDGKEPAEWNWWLTWAGTDFFHSGSTVSTLETAQAEALGAIPELVKERDAHYAAVEAARRARR